jgi:hypothetical protein
MYGDHDVCKMRGFLHLHFFKSWRDLAYVCMYGDHDACKMRGFLHLHFFKSWRDLAPINKISMYKICLSLTLNEYLFVRLIPSLFFF